MPDKRTKGVIMELMPTTDKRAAWEAFLLELDGAHGNSVASSHKEMVSLKMKYKNFFNDQELINKLREISSVEEKIIQLNCFIDPHVQIGHMNQRRNNETVTYIIARAPFLTPGVNRRELRVYLGRLEDFDGRSIADVEQDKDVLKMAKEKITEAMKQEMKRS